MTDTAPQGAALSALPGAADISTLLDGLLDRGVTAVQEERPVLPGRDVRVVAAYVDDAQDVRAVILLDLSLGNGLGAALALVPVTRVTEAVGADQVLADLAENTKEVLNIAASLFNCGDVHLKLAEVAVAPDPVGGRAVDFLRVPRRRTDLRVTIPGYVTGVFAVVASS